MSENEANEVVDGGLIVWSWRDEGFQQEDSYASSEEIFQEPGDDVKDEGDKEGSESDEESVTCDLQHTVCFKCIGVTLEHGYQQVLRDIANMPDVKTVPVLLCPEPDNPVDAKAIAFVVSMSGKKHRIGYAVTEVVDDLHAAMASSSIVRVEFKWVKYRLDWYRTGPAYYCGINITRRGVWSRVVVRHCSTR